MPFLDRLEAAGRDAWLSAVNRLNKLFASLFAAASAAYAAYPDSVKGMISSLPKWAIFPAAVGVFLFINHALKRAKG